MHIRRLALIALPAVLSVPVGAVASPLRHNMPHASAQGQGELGTIAEIEGLADE